MRSFLPLFLAAGLAITLPGCQTPQTFPAPTAAWQTYSGQMQYVSTAGKSVIGEVVVRRSRQGDFQLAFSSGPGFPLLRLWQSGTRVRAEGALARGSWQGEAAQAPAHLKGWVAVPAYFAQGQPGKAAFTAPNGERFSFSFGS